MSQDTLHDIKLVEVNMEEFPTKLFNRCRALLLSECKDEFDSNESVKNIFLGTEIAAYSRHFHEQNNPDARIDEVIRALKDRSHEGKSVLARFLEELAQRSYPEGDDTRTNLIRLAHDIQAWKQANISSLRSAQHLPSSNNTQQLSEDEKSKRVLVIWGQDEAAGIEMFEFLSGANLLPMKWSQVEARMEKNQPSIDEILNAAFDIVQAVIVVFTSDYLAELKKASAVQDNSVNGKNLRYHPEPDILFTAGTAFGIDQKRTILVALGNMQFSHMLLDRYVIYLTNDEKDRRKLITKLRHAQCTITGNKWIDQGNFYKPDFS
jgi:hypothetical protein